MSGQKSELDGQRDDDDGGDDVEGDGAAAQRIVKVLHGRVRVREAGAGQVIDLGRHLQTLLVTRLTKRSSCLWVLPDSVSFILCLLPSFSEITMFGRSSLF